MNQGARQLSGLIAGNTMEKITVFFPKEIRDEIEQLKKEKDMSDEQIVQLLLQLGLQRVKNEEAIV